MIIIFDIFNFKTQFTFYCYFVVLKILINEKINIFNYIIFMLY